HPMADSTLPPPDAPPTTAAARSAPEIEPTHTDARAPEHVRDADYPLFAPGDRIGRYVILSSLGKGGMSVVFLAYDPELDRKVALKLMRVNMLGEKGRLRLQREAQALAKLSHPNVVPVYDAGTVGDQAFVAMEFVEGKTLRKWLKDGHDWREVLAVLMGEDGRVRVLDFGLARLASVLDGSLPASTPSLDSDAPPSTGSFPSTPVR